MPKLYSPTEVAHKGHPAVEVMAELRGRYVAAVEERRPVPPRFDFDLSQGKGIVVSDLETGRQCRFRLSDYDSVRKVLGALFAEEEKQ